MIIQKFIKAIVFLILFQFCINCINAQENNYQDEYVFTEASKLKLLGDYKRSYKLFKKYIDKNPGSAAAYQQLAHIHLITGDKQEAYENNLKAISLDSTNSQYYYFMADLSRLRNDAASLAQAYNGLIKQDINDAQVYLELIYLYRLTKNYNEALKVLKQVKSKFGVNKDVIMSEYDITYQVNPDSALEIINNAIKLYNSEITYQIVKAEHYFRNKQFQQAEETYKQIFEIDSLNINAQVSELKFLLAKNDFKKAINKMNMLITNENVEEEVKFEMLASMLEKKEMINNWDFRFLQLIGKFEKFTNNKEKAISLRTDLYLKKSDLVNGLRSLKQLLHYEKSNYAFWEQVILIENQFARTDSVIKYCDNALVYFPEVSNLYLIKGISLYQQKQFQRSVNTLLKGYGKVNDSKIEEQFLMFLGESYENLKEYSESETYFKKLFEKYPENIMAKNNYAYYLSLRSDNLKYAKELSEETIAMEPDNGTFLDTYAWILYKLGKYRKAYRYIEKAILNGNTNNAEVLEHAGDIMIKINKAEDAIYMYKRAYDISKDNRIKEKIIKYE